MSPKKFAQYVRQQTHTTSETFTDSEILLSMNLVKDDLATMVVDGVDEDYFGMPATTNLVADQREYPLPSDMLNRIKAVEAKFDGTNWVRLLSFDLANYDRTTDETTITNFFGNGQGQAYYDLWRKSLWLYSGTIADVTAGLKLWFLSWPPDIDDLTDETDMSIDPTTTSSGMPRSLHKVWAEQVIIEFKNSSDTPIPLTEHEQTIFQRTQKLIAALKPMSSEDSYIGTLPNDRQGFNL